MSSKILRPALLCLFIFASLIPSQPLRADRPQRRVVEIKLETMIHQVSAEFVERGIRYADDQNADAILLELNTPGGLVSSTQELVQAIYASRVPVIAYVAPSGASAASGGFFVLLAGDLAIMAPGTNTGASHPVDLLGGQADKTMSEKIENDLASYIRSIAQKRGRNVTLADDAVRKTPRSQTRKPSRASSSTRWRVRRTKSSPSSTARRFNASTAQPPRCTWPEQPSRPTQ